MAIHKIAGTQTTTFYVDIEADSLDEALDSFDPHNDDNWYGVNTTLDIKSA
jgi:hypothetical protein